MKGIQHSLKQLYINGRVLARYGTLSPGRVQLVGTDRFLHVNPRDGRARRKLISGTAHGKYPRNQRFFREAVSAFAPDVVLDVGLNYGECLFSLEYPPDAKLFGFEANSGLRDYVEASRAEHPNRNQMELLFQLVTDGETGTADFFVDKKWSGGSTAGLDPHCYDRGRYELVTVPKGSVDGALAAQDVTPRKLFFKIDVEGFEPGVIAGMQRTLSAAEQAVGFLEFSIPMLSRAGFNVPAYWSSLREQFRVFLFDRQNRVHAAGNLELSDLDIHCGSHQHTDIVLIHGDNRLADQVLAGWRGETSSRAAA